MEFMAAIDRLAFDRRGERLECHILQQQHQQMMLQRYCATAVRLVYKLPLAEILVDFADKLQSVTSGAATFDVEDAGKCPLRSLLLRLLPLLFPVPLRHCAANCLPRHRSARLGCIDWGNGAACLGCTYA